MSGRKFGIVTISFILLILFCMKGTVMSMGDRQRAEENYYYLALEQEYLRSVRAYLNGQGFDNCGVMMTRVTYEDGTREYRVQIHHRKLDRMNREDRMNLKKRLSQEEFKQDVCIFSYQFS